MSFFFKNRKIRGFTLIELLVTMSIMIVILMTVSLNQNKYSAGISLKNTANTIGLYIRQAQTYGVSVRETSTGSGNFSNGYGVAFTTVGSGNNTKYIYFTDQGSPRNKVFDGPWTCPSGSPCDEFVEGVNITNNNRISDLCVITTFNGTDTETCGLGRIDITFQRPKIDTYFKFFDSTATMSVDYLGVKGAKIKLTSVQGDTRSVVVYITGQISVQ